MKELRILLVGGGSGGHVYPLIAVARALREKAPSLQVELKMMMLGDRGFLEQAAKENSIPYRTISAGKLRRYFSLETVKDIFKIPLSLIQSFWHIFLFMPDAVFTKGGYVSFAPALIARIFFIPVYIHESDSIPGLANTLIGTMARKVFLSFKLAEKYFEGKEVLFTGNPVRKSLAHGDKDAARNFFDLHDLRPTIFVVGGSQGAKAINEVLVSSLVILAKKYNIIHQCGQSQYDSVKKDIDTILTEGTNQYSAPIKIYYRYYPYLNEEQIAMAFALGDIIISRAGSGSLFEIAQAGKPAVIVPLPMPQSANNHQYFNAFEFANYGGVMIEEANFNRDSLMREIEKLLEKEIYLKTIEKIKKFASPEAADKIAEELLKC
jgi:UDP-N-acetylglucosamine--N-acetylmuramyl-(pentapeptide) pyrophosphoryl-undecaprenol N-acetylglucosamine transferase